MSQRVQLIVSAADLHFEKDIFYVCEGISIEPDHKVHIRSKQWAKSLAVHCDVTQFPESALVLYGCFRYLK